jgi:hypothetical protein
MPEREPWTEEELREPEDPDTWDWETEVARGPSPAPGAYIRVPFVDGELTSVVECARKHDMDLTEFIRRTVLERVLAERS